MKKPVALFDFDNTLARGDSIAHLVKYGLKTRPLYLFYLLGTGIFYIAYLLHLTGVEKAKSLLLYPLRFMSEEELKDFYQKKVAVHYYPHVIEELKQRKKEGCFVIVCTASCETYMRYHDLPIDAMIGTVYENGRIQGKNCRYENKVPRILECLSKQGIEIDYENSYGYSDSDSDRPMLSLVKHKKRVLLKTGKIVEFK